MATSICPASHCQGNSGVLVSHFRHTDRLGVGLMRRRGNPYKKLILCGFLLSSSAFAAAAEPPRLVVATFHDGIASHDEGGGVPERSGAIRAPPAHPRAGVSRAFDGPHRFEAPLGYGLHIPTGSTGVRLQAHERVHPRHPRGRLCGRGVPLRRRARRPAEHAPRRHGADQGGQNRRSTSPTSCASSTPGG